MDVRTTMTNTVVLLRKNHIEEAALEARVLVQHILGLSSSQLYAQLERPVTEHQLANLTVVTRRRLDREPLSYILNGQPFLARDFYVDSRVLIPRPETELLVEKAIEFIGDRDCSVVADIGTGSGIIAVSLALARPGLRVFASDISVEALAVARINCVRYNVTDRVSLLHGRLLEPIPGPVDLVVANLPYVREADMARLDPELTYEPRSALCGGRDGLRQIRRLLRDTAFKIRPMGGVLLEIGDGQLKSVLTLVTRYLPQAQATVFRDFNEHDRVVRLVF